MSVRFFADAHRTTPYKSREVNNVEQTSIEVRIFAVYSEKYSNILYKPELYTNVKSAT